MDFRSDNAGPCAAPILDALVEANRGAQAPYGEDGYSVRLRQAYSDLFETEVDVFPVATGTAANALSLSALAPPWGAIYCQRDAHIQSAECNAPEFYSGGAKLVGLPGDGHAVEPDALAQTLARAGIGKSNRAQPSALSLTQPTEYGTVYPPAQVAELAAIAHAHGMGVHMDGARFANALARLGCSPAQASWMCGVDILSFGATKNGALSAEAIVVFDRSLAEALRFRCRRAGHVWSKMRYAAAQLLAYTQDDLWLRLAGQANASAHQLADGLEALPFARLLAPVQVNILHVSLPAALVDALQQRGVLFYRRSDTHIRLVCRHDTPQEDVRGLPALMAELASGLNPASAEQARGATAPGAALDAG